MTRLIISTNIREAAYDEPSGHLYVVDLEKRKLLRKASGIEHPYRKSDHNPRGGTRGLRGLSFYNGELVVAGFSVLFFFDCSWNLLRTITHPSVSAIHEIAYNGDGVWVTSTANDLLVRFDLTGKIQEYDYLRVHRNLMIGLGGPRRLVLNHEGIMQGSSEFRDRSYFKSDEYDRTHLNGIALMPDGKLLLSLGLVVGDLFAFLDQVKGWMLNIGIWNAFLSINRFVRRVLGLKKKMLSDLVAQPKVSRSVIISGYPNQEWRPNLQLKVAQNPSHSPRLLADGTVLYLETSHGNIVHFDLQGTILSSTKISENFLRGLLVLPNGWLAIGAGNILLIYDFEKREVIWQLELTSNVKASIFDIKILADDFDLPPETMEEKIGWIVGFEGTTVIWKK